MGKETTTITLDSELKKEAKARLINISGFTEETLREKLGKKQVEIDKATNCELCGREGEQEKWDFKNNREHLNTKSNGLTWLYPDQIWICNSCLRHQGMKLNAGTNA